MGPGDLARVLQAVPSQSDPRLLVGRETFDDAGIFALSEDIALVQTVDFFAPIVDDPHLFGEIAAANALSDIYAMGGVPLTALNIVGFPTGSLPLEVLSDILRGGQEKVHEAGALIVGGHSIIDEELKYGLAVTGRADPRRLLTNAAARPGDRLVLTKPIGTGVLTTVAKQRALPADQAEALHDTMRELNATASRAALAVGVRCATDVTGFGLLGHALHIARASGVSLVLHPRRVPFLPGARVAAEHDVRTGGAERNDAYLSEYVAWRGTSAAERALLVDPQTSGGLLLAMGLEQMAEYLALVPNAVEIGAVADVQDMPLILE